MEAYHRELLVARICSGTVRVQVREANYVLVRPTVEDQYMACEVYSETFQRAELEGVYNEQDLLDFLLLNELWDEESQKFLDTLPKEIEEFKVQLYRASFRSNEQQVVRKALAVAKAKLLEVAARRAAYNHLSCAGLAAVAKTRFIISRCLRTEDGRQAIGADDRSPLLEETLAAWTSLRLEEATFRELVRNDPWRSTWAAHKAEGNLFGWPASSYTDEQKAMVAWSSLYENVYQNPDCPPDVVIEDDDLMDGWLIEQRRKREERLGQGEGEKKLGSDKIRNSQEVYLLADTVKDAKKVMDMNDPMAKATQKQRFDYLKKKGEVNELEMPDTRRRLIMEINRKLAADVTGK